jgi:zinc transport system substrate-binding protein
MPVVNRTVFATVIAALLTAWPSLAPPEAADSGAPDVVASIAPVHALVAQVMAGVGAPRLLMAAGASPHAYALKPSDARAIAGARAVFWIGPELERFLVKPLTALTAEVPVVALAGATGVQLLSARKTGAWAGGDRDHDHAKGDADQNHDGADPHLWLDPVNAAAMVRTIVATLAAVDAANAARYRANGEVALADLRRLESELVATLAPVKHVPYVVFHDAYQYFERRFGLAAAGAIAVGAGRAPGARRIAELRQTIFARRAVCVFTEPQFEPALAKTLIEGSGAHLGALDPLGAGLNPGPGLYRELMRSLARSLVGCLKPVQG